MRGVYFDNLAANCQVRQPFSLARRRIVLVVEMVGVAWMPFACFAASQKTRDTRVRPATTLNLQGVKTGWRAMLFSFGP
jgi:hypothetical protein